MKLGVCPAQGTHLTSSSTPGPKLRKTPTHPHPNFEYYFFAMSLLPLVAMLFLTCHTTRVCESPLYINSVHLFISCIIANSHQRNMCTSRTDWLYLFRYHFPPTSEDTQNFKRSHLFWLEPYFLQESTTPIFIFNLSNLYSLDRLNQIPQMDRNFFS